MEAISLQELGIYLAINTAFLGACWMVVRHALSGVRGMLAAHAGAEADTLRRLEDSIEASAEAAARAAGRIERLEARSEQLPTVSMVHQLSISVTQLAGKVETVEVAASAKIEAMRVMGERLDIIVRRIEDYLASRNH